MPTPIAQALVREQLRLHISNTPASAAASLISGAVMVALLWGQLRGQLVVGWGLALLAAAALRMAIRHLHLRADKRQQPGQASAFDWRWPHRLAYLAHGLVWASLVLLLPDGMAHQGMDVAVLILLAMCGGSLITGAHDPPASYLFVAPAITPLGLHLLTHGHEGDETRAMAAAVSLFLGVLGMAGRRAYHMLTQQVRADQAEASRFEDMRRLAGEAETARRALADEHSLLQQLLQGTPQGFWFIGPDGRTLDLNPAMCALLGRSREEVLGRNVFDFFTGPERAVLDAALERRRQGLAGGYEIDIVRADGTRLHCHNNATPVVDSTGRAVGSIGLWTDLTAQKRLELELRTYERVTNSISEVVSVIGEERQFRLVNDAWCRAVGLRREQAVGMRTGNNPIGMSSPERTVLLNECFASGKVSTVTSPAVLHDGTAAVLHTTFYPYRDAASGEKVRAVILVTRNIAEQERDRQAALASAEYLKRTLNATGDAIFATDASDPDMPVRFINEQMLQMWGLHMPEGRLPTSTEIMETAMQLLADPAAESRRVSQIIAASAQDESRVPLRDGRVLRRRCESAQVNDLTLRVWSFRDVTAEEQALRVLHEGQAELRAVLRAFPGYISAVDDHYRYVYLDDRLEPMLGRPAAQALGQRVVDVIGTQRFAQVGPELQRAFAGEQVRAVRNMPAGPDGALRTLELMHVAGPRRADGSCHVYTFGADVTERMQAQAALAHARDEAERANQAKSQFLSHMSHELRTPLNAIGGFAQLLLRDQRPQLQAHQLTFARQIHRGAEHLLSLINELLDLSTIEAGRLVLQPTAVPVRSLVEDCLNLVRGLAQERGVTLLAPTGLQGEGDEAAPVLQADRTRVRQVLLNLLGNAVKYGGSGCEVSVSCLRDEDMVHLAVRDTGRGLNREEQARLFKPFERLGAANGPIEGTGIGLALCQRLVQAMGGQIGVHSQVGRGSTFWVRLPAAQEAAAKAADSTWATLTEPAALPAPQAPTVLYVDDNAINVMLMEGMLAHAPGIRLISADQAAEGLGLAQRERPALVLLDIHMPGMDGYEVLARLRADSRTQAIPVVAVSADAARGDIDAALAAGFAAYLTKPLDFDALLGTVRKLLQAPGPEAAIAQRQHEGQT